MAFRQLSPTPERQCLSNARLIVQACCAYADDNDGRLPPTGGWLRSVRAFAPGDADLAPDCPLGAYYALNRNLGYWLLGKVPDPEGTGYCYDADTRWRPCYVHNDRATVGFVDGHAKLCSEAEVKALTW